MGPPPATAPTCPDPSVPVGAVLPAPSCVGTVCPWTCEDAVGAAVPVWAIAGDAAVAISRNAVDARSSRRKTSRDIPFFISYAGSLPEPCLDELW